MHTIKAYYKDDDGNSKEFIVKVYSCPHCQSQLEFTQSDTGRALISCSMCDYWYWVYLDGHTEGED